MHDLISVILSHPRGEAILVKVLSSVFHSHIKVYNVSFIWNLTMPSNNVTMEQETERVVNEDL